MRLGAEGKPPLKHLDTDRTIGAMGGNSRVGVHGDQHDLQPWFFVQRHGVAGALLPRVFAFDLRQQGRDVKRQ